MTTTFDAPEQPAVRTAPVPPSAAPRAAIARRMLRGRTGDERWVRPGLLVLLVGTACLYLWGLGASGWANAYYSAAVQAGTESWKAFFFGSFDAASSITVDKTPASLWVMSLSARAFGVSSWSILVPQALMGVGAVWLLYATVRRCSTPAAGLLAGAALALTPVATLMFRFNNPDALLVLLLVGAAYATLRAVERASTRWLVLAGTLVGFGFLTKMLQALLVIPALAAVYLVAAPTPVRRRILQVLAAAAAVVVSAGWWVAIVELTPAQYRPYIGGSQTNSVLELMLGYNGLGRITGDETGSVGGGNGWGVTGWARMFNGDIGGQIAWLLPAALVLLAAGLWSRWHASRTDLLRAAYLLWGGWLLVTALVFSFMAGIFHAYYTVALAPAIAALVAMGAVSMWRLRRSIVARVVLAVVVGATSAWAYVLLGRSPDWLSWLRILVLTVGLVAAAGLVAMRWLPRAVGRVAVIGALLAVLAGPAAYSLDTAETAHTGSIPTAGPAVVSSGFGPGGGRAFGGTLPQGGFTGPTGTLPGQGGFGRGGPGQGAPGQGAPGQGVAPGQGTMPGGGAAPVGGGGMGGLLDATTPDAELVAALSADASSYRWVVATVGANNAAGYQLATGDPVMAIGGFNGSDPSPTLAEFQAYVAAGDVHYFIAGGVGGMGSGTGSNAAAEIRAWVTSTFPSATVGGVELYDLTAGTSDVVGARA